MVIVLIQVMVELNTMMIVLILKLVLFQNLFNLLMTNLKVYYLLYWEQ